MPDPMVLYAKEGHIATITLNRPDVLNAVSNDMALELDACIEKAKRDDEVWVVLLTGNGKSFCSGYDLKGITTGRITKGATPAVNRQGHIGWSALRLWEIEKPTIAAIRGHAVGGGLCLALACDMRIATEDARFAATFTKRGLVPDSGATFFLIQSVGYAKACEMSFLAEQIDAQEALRLGLVNRVIKDPGVEKAAMETAQKMLLQSPIAVRLAKRALRRGMEAEATRAVEYELYLNSITAKTNDITEGARAFVEKRPPKWTGT
jgi:2-(1,2-epoxy-1,2-dihydrophenyl)acetyl-CoA isomerase